MKKNSIIWRLSALLLIIFSAYACNPNYETEFKEYTLEVADDDLALISFSAEGGSKDIKVTTNVEKANWAATSNADWLKIDKQAEKVIVSADKNELFVPRIARLTIAYGHQAYSIDVAQRTALSSEILIEGKKEGTVKELPITGGKISVKVSSNMTLDYITVPDSTAWIKWVSTQDLGDGKDKLLTFNVDPTYSGNPRSSFITLQSAQNPNYTSSFRVKQNKKTWGDPIPVPLTFDMLSANATQEGDGAELPGLIDGNINTFYHTLWSAPSPGAKPHYVQINLKTPLQFMLFEYSSRPNGDGGGDVTRVGIWVSETGGNKDSDWKKASTLYFPLPKGRAQKTTATEVAVFDKLYKYIRFTPEARRNANPIDSSGRNGWWNMGELYVMTFNE